MAVSAQFRYIARIVGLGILILVSASLTRLGGDIDVEYVTAAFRGSDGRVDLAIHYEVEARMEASRAGTAGGPARLEMGGLLQDTTGRFVTDARDTLALSLDADQAAAAAGHLSLSAAPDSYRVAVQARSLGSVFQVGTRRYAQRLGSQFKRLPDYSAPRLAVSDLLTVTSIRPAGDSSGYRRGGFSIDVHPSARYSARQPVAVYFEIYHLALNEDDRTDYTVTYTLTPAAEEVGLWDRLFGSPSSEPPLSLQIPRSGRETSPSEYAELDVSTLDPGEYILRVTADDQVANASASTSRKVTISVPGG